MNEVENIYEELCKWWKETVESAKAKTTEKDLGADRKNIQVELPEPPSGGYSDTEYDEWRRKVNGIILEAIPRGYKLQSSDVKEIITVRHYADIVVEKA